MKLMCNFVIFNKIWRYSCSIPTSMLLITTGVVYQNLHWKLGLSCLLRDYGLNHIFFLEKHFFAFLDRELKFSTSGWKGISWNLKKFQLIQTILFPLFLFLFWLTKIFVRFHEILFQTDVESSSFLSWKTKKFSSPKKYNLGHSL